MAGLRILAVWMDLCPNHSTILPLKGECKKGRSQLQHGVSELSG